MKQAMTRLAKWTWSGIQMILTYIFLMIDRQILVPFQWISSYSATELQKKPDRYSSFAILRVLIALAATAIILLIKYIF